MRYAATILVILLINSNTQAQNIVPNPSFAIDSLCPVFGSPMNYCQYWRAPTKGTSDYFNACSTVGVSVPNNFNGSQNSNDSAYAGFYTYSDPAFSTVDYREYVATTIPALLVGATYKISIVISLADSSSYGSDGLGVYFSTHPLIDTAYVGTLTLMPQIDYSSLSTVVDKTNWVTLSKTFVADSAYTNIVIGSFKNNMNAHVVHLSGDTYFTYYYMDSVAVEKVIPGGINDVHSAQPFSQIYPNPVNGRPATLHFEYVPGAQYTLNIYNIEGKAVYRTEGITTGDVTIQDLEKGFYFYQLSDGTNLTAHGRFVVE
jgi:OmpA-OmpF porin, OOP family